MDNQGHKTGGRQKDSRNKSTQEREETAAKTVALVGDMIPNAFPGDAHAFLVAIYKDPQQDQHAREIAARAALPFEKARPVTVVTGNQGAEPPKVRSELDIGRRLAFVLGLIARGEVKAKIPKGAPLLDGIPTSQIASHCGSSKVDENREPQAKTEPAVGSEPASLVPSGRPPQ